LIVGIVRLLNLRLGMSAQHRTGPTAPSHLVVWAYSARHHAKRNRAFRTKRGGAFPFQTALGRLNPAVVHLKPDSGCQRQRLSFIVEAMRQPSSEKKANTLKGLAVRPFRTSEAHRLP
jgi:hypothetical protein